MAQPQPYSRTVDFSQRDGNNTDHNAINAEFDASALTVGQLRVNLGLIQQDDGALRLGQNLLDALRAEFDAQFAIDLVAVTDILTAAEVAAAQALTRSAAAALSQYNAALSELGALGLLNDFKGRYYGPSDFNPLIDPLGAAVGTGDMYFNTLLARLKIYDGAAWLTI
jgi:hypothetical protein